MKVYERYSFGTIDFRGAFGVEEAAGVFTRWSAWFNEPWSDANLSVHVTDDGLLVEMLFASACLYSPRDKLFLTRPHRGVSARELDRLMSEELR